MMRAKLRHCSEDGKGYIPEILQISHLVTTQQEGKERKEVRKGGRYNMNASVMRTGKLILSSVRIATRKIDLEGKIMNLGLYALNLRYQQYIITSTLIKE